MAKIADDKRITPERVKAAADAKGLEVDRGLAFWFSERRACGCVVGVVGAAEYGIMEDPPWGATTFSILADKHGFDRSYLRGVSDGWEYPDEEEGRSMMPDQDLYEIGLADGQACARALGSCYQPRSGHPC
jgi:hypothetical protein